MAYIFSHGFPKFGKIIANLGYIGFLIAIIMSGAI